MVSRSMLEASRVVVAGRDLTLEAATLVVAELGKRRGGGPLPGAGGSGPPGKGPERSVVALVKKK